MLALSLYISLIFAGKRRRKQEKENARKGQFVFCVGGCPSGILSLKYADWTEP
jgi:hypothetical protein